jgi:hypothetical protein
MSKCSKSCNPSSNFERLKEIYILSNCVIGIANLTATRMSGPNSVDDLFHKAKSRLMHLIPGEPLSIVSREVATDPEGAVRNIVINGLRWKVVRHGDTVVAHADVDAMKSTAVVQFSSKQDVVKTLSRATEDVQKVMAAHTSKKPGATKKSKPVINPGGTLKPKVKTVSSVETVKAKAKKKGKA